MRPLVVYLAYLPYEPELVERFLASYEDHPAGLDHDLLIVQKGEGEAPEHSHRVETVAEAEAGYDLGAYLWVVRNFEAPRYLFLNSFTVILADGWLEKLSRHLGGPVGMTGASGSHGEAVDKSVLFPNPHLRTTAFMLERDLALDLDWLEPIVTKQDAYDVENGPRSLTTQVRERGLEVMVVGNDGEGYPVERWPESNTFWHGTMENLLIGDRATARYGVHVEGLPIPNYRAQRAMCLAAWGCLDGWVPT